MWGRTKATGFTIHKQLTLNWKKDSKASGYDIVCTVNGNKKTVNIKKNSTTSYTFKKLKRKANCSVKIRAYVMVNGKKLSGAYSQVKKKKIK